jgi:hypothetical protein
MPCDAPAPPLHMKWMSPNGCPVRGFRPIVAGAHQRAQAASTRSGAACASASQTASMIACEAEIVLPVTGAGSSGFTIDPSGAITSSARSAPSLMRTPAPIEVNRARYDDEAVLAIVELT